MVFFDLRLILKYAFKPFCDIDTRTTVIKRALKDILSLNRN